MKIYYDTEFLENGRTIELISIGMVAENGDELYAVVADDGLMDRVAAHPWLVRHVLPSLPVAVDYDRHRQVVYGPVQYNPVRSWRWDAEHPDWPRVLPRRRIADEVRQFIGSFPDPRLWAWYGAYDHVALCQLWGRRVDLPSGVPMWTNDLKQEAVRLGDPRLPEQEAGEHNALEDARHNLVMARALAEYASRRP